MSDIQVTFAKQAPFFIFFLTALEIFRNKNKDTAVYTVIFFFAATLFELRTTTCETPTQVMYESSVPTPHETLASTAKSSQLMLLRETVTVSSKNHTRPINIL
jgi:hypothetical protein